MPEPVVPVAPAVGSYVDFFPLKADKRFETSPVRGTVTEVHEPDVVSVSVPTGATESGELEVRCVSRAKEAEPRWAPATGPAPVVKPKPANLGTDPKVDQQVDFYPALNDPRFPGLDPVRGVVTVIHSPDVVDLRVGTDVVNSVSRVLGSVPRWAAVAGAPGSDSVVPKVGQEVDLFPSPTDVRFNTSPVRGTITVVHSKGIVDVKVGSETLTSVSNAMAAVPRWALVK